MALVLYQILLVPITLACYLVLIYGTHCDPLNILQNGELTSLVVHFDLFHSLDIIANDINTLIPYWIFVHGVVQVLDPTIHNLPPNSNITFIMHMNFYRGQKKKEVTSLGLNVFSLTFIFPIYFMHQIRFGYIICDS
jgi:hypothetical protein